MPNPDKVGAVAEITSRFNRSSAVVLTDYRGLTVAQLKELRTSLGATSTYAVVKNTLTKRAVSAVGYDDLAPLLIGPTAIAFIEGEPVEAAKALRNFSRTNPLLIIKGGVLDGKMLSTEEINSLADLESREVLLGRLAGGMKASLSKAAALFQAPLSQVARLAAALAEKKPAAEAASDAAPEASAAEAATEAAATDPTPTPEPAEPPAASADTPS
ncbi:MAG: 50S ribosomal protein L10 [Geodermatophilaceae bacterium]|nr:50S ribosomal protein L10 [Geodermatophilaceae bacterium]